MKCSTWNPMLVITHRNRRPLTSQPHPSLHPGNLVHPLLPSTAQPLIKLCYEHMSNDIYPENRSPASTGFIGNTRNLLSYARSCCSLPGYVSRLSIPLSVPPSPNRPSPLDHIIL